MPPHSMDEEDTLSPIALLPPEIICHIFILVVPPQTATSAAVPILIRRSWDEAPILGVPWVFGQVCSQWRTLSASLTTLWTSITVSTTILPRELPFLCTQLARTGSAPLDVFVRFTANPRRCPETLHAKPWDEAFNTFLRTLLPHSDRWRTLWIRFDGYPSPSANLTILYPQTLPNLEALTIDNIDKNVLSRSRFFDLSAPTPALRRVAIDFLSDGLLADLQHLPWNRLKKYKLRCDGTNHLHNLAAAPALVECDIHVWPPPNPFTSMRGTPVTLLRVRRLVLSNSLFLDMLTAPALESLHILGPVDKIGPFLRRSGCMATLAQLTLRYCTAPIPDIVALLRQTRGLTTLALHLVNPPAELVAALAGPAGLCPNLDSLLWADFEDALDRNAFVDMVASRMRKIDSTTYDSAGVRPLRSVALYAGRRRMKGAGRRLRALDGLEVLILNAKKGTPAVTRWRYEHKIVY
ncbi:hypothetical protein B0H19DRAFT_1129315 [Mycena capillaripes]|nr:hypothetical protein B0H19DRAFT_1129315 [Mycena capillaripes]